MFFDNLIRSKSTHSASSPCLTCHPCRSKRSILRARRIRFRRLILGAWSKKCAVNAEISIRKVCVHQWRKFEVRPFEVRLFEVCLAEVPIDVSVLPGATRSREPPPSPAERCGRRSPWSIPEQGRPPTKIVLRCHGQNNRTASPIISRIVSHVSRFGEYAFRYVSLASFSGPFAECPLIPQQRRESRHSRTAASGHKSRHQLSAGLSRDASSSQGTQCILNDRNNGVARHSTGGWQSFG